MGKPALLVKLDGGYKNCGWIYRFRANPGRPRGGILPPAPVLAPGAALGSRPRVALSSAQAPSMELRRGGRSKRLLPGLGAPPGVGLRQSLAACGPDRLGATGQLVGRRDGGDRALQ